MKVALHARVSTDDKGQDPLNQFLQLREFCKRQGWSIVQEYEDEISGGKSDRTAFQLMWKDAARHKFQVLLFWSLDRFTREGTLPTLLYLQRLSSLGIAYKSFAEPFIDSLGPFRDAIIGIIAATAQQERIRQSERVKAGIARVRAQGCKWGRPVDPKACSPVTMWRRSRENK